MNVPAIPAAPAPIPAAPAPIPAAPAPAVLAAPGPGPAAPAAPPNPTPVVLPAPPNDPGLQLPPAPVYPPTQLNVLDAVEYRSGVFISQDTGTVGACCTDQDLYNAIIYEHSVINQAAAVAAPQAIAPAWFQNAAVQLQAGITTDISGTIMPDLKRLLNKARGDGRSVPYDIVPLPNGDDPTQPPYNLPHLTTKNVVYGLPAPQLNDYLARYGVGPVVPGPNPHATNQRKKAALMRKIKA